MNDYPSEFRPIRSLIFDDVVPISAKAGGTGVEYLKNRLRDVLDLHAEMQNAEQVEENAKLLTKTQENLRERGPKLV